MTKASDRQSETVKSELQDLDDDDELLTALDGHGECWVQDMQMAGSPNNIGWPPLGLGDRVKDEERDKCLGCSGLRALPRKRKSGISSTAIKKIS